MINVSEYFDGKVKSMGCLNSDGELTVGVMEEGSYVFSTSKKEFMKVISGELKVVLPNETQERVIGKDGEFIVAANEKFRAIATQNTIYTCKYE